MNNPGKFFDGKSDSDMEKFKRLSPSTTPFSRESLLGINSGQQYQFQLFCQYKNKIVKIIF